MPLATLSTTVDEAIADVRERLGDIEEKLEGLDAGTDRTQALQQQRATLQFRANGLLWMRDEEGWGGDARLELGAPTAGEQALMSREVPADAGASERTLWFVAAGTETAPYVGEGMEETFEGLVDVHQGFVAWAEARLNDLATPGNAIRRSSTSSQATPAETPSTSEDTSTT